jgi:hypothetical protein
MDAELIRADAALYTLWRIAKRRTEWVKVLGGHNPNRASYVEVYTVGGEYLGRIWRRELVVAVDALSEVGREELTAHTDSSRYRRLYRSRGERQVGEVLHGVALELGKLVREVKRELSG